MVSDNIPHPFLWIFGWQQFFCSVSSFWLFCRLFLFTSNFLWLSPFCLHSCQNGESHHQNCYGRCFLFCDLRLPCLFFSFTFKSFLSLSFSLLSFHLFLGWYLVLHAFHVHQLILHPYWCCSSSHVSLTSPVNHGFHYQVPSRYQALQTFPQTPLQLLWWFIPNSHKHRRKTLHWDLHRQRRHRLRSTSTGRFLLRVWNLSTGLIRYS